MIFINVDRLSRFSSYMTLIKKRLLENLNSRRLDSALNIIVSYLTKVFYDESLALPLSTLLVSVYLLFTIGNIDQKILGSTAL